MCCRGKCSRVHLVHWRFSVSAHVRERTICGPCVLIVPEGNSFTEDKSVKTLTGNLKYISEMNSVITLLFVLEWRKKKMVTFWQKGMVC